MVLTKSLPHHSWGPTQEQMQIHHEVLKQHVTSDFKSTYQTKKQTLLALISN